MTTNDKYFAVILAGGRGERFWPLSTAARPKQLLSLVGDTPLIKQAVDRLSGLIPPDHIYVITNQDLVEATRSVVPALSVDNIVGEPVGRDTAAAVALGAALLKSRRPDAVFCVLTADHVIDRLDSFRETLSSGLDYAAKENVLITIGIPPAGPNTGYGYIKAGDIVEPSTGLTTNIEFRRSLRFVEKPNVEKAREYVSAGNFYWNSGMFIWSVKSLQEALGTHRPALNGLIDRLAGAVGSADFSSVMAHEYENLEKISIDYALMEKARNVVMAKGEFRWDDVGSWSALEDHLPKDASGNVVVGSCEQVQSNGNVVVSKDRLTALVGVHDLVVVQGDGVTLVCPKDRAQDVKKLVEKLRSDPRYREVL